MGSAATIRSRKMRRLFEGGYNYMSMWRYAYARIIVCLLFSASVASKVDEAFYFDSIMHGHHIYVQDSVDSAEGWRDCRPRPVHAIADGATFSLNVRGVEGFVLLCCGSGHSQSLALCLRTCRFCCRAPWRL